MDPTSFGVIFSDDCEDIASVVMGSETRLELRDFRKFLKIFKVC